MDQHSPKNEAAPFKLPEVQPERKDAEQVYESSANNANEESMAKSVEQNTNAKPLANPIQSTSPIAFDPLSLNNQSTSVDPKTPAKKIAVTDSLPANDIDLIEKAWVVKAKAIVAQTKNDPYEQSDEIKKIRDDYQSKRFNTNLKIDQE